MSNSTTTQRPAASNRRAPSNNTGGASTSSNNARASNAQLVLDGSGKNAVIRDPTGRLLNFGLPYLNLPVATMTYSYMSSHRIMRHGLDLENISEKRCEINRKDFRRRLKKTKRQINRDLNAVHKLVMELMPMYESDQRPVKRLQQLSKLQENLLKIQQAMILIDQEKVVQQPVQHSKLQPLEINKKLVKLQLTLLAIDDVQDTLELEFKNMVRAEKQGLVQEPAKQPAQVPPKKK
ncbi:hypothetical protein LPJ73_001300 [Coemansia sp. RSA 2703]|nr:hypothetical protein LPJ73_001300 [Coemansia sp. RSA 2703]KAJ2373074.1 hypothetical protein IW150_003799 [Coemansia sp. RSA 2607]KAJ2395947.1 hypothetical protein GGI05_001349 [Coemansia sp. RSA 2603]